MGASHTVRSRPAGLVLVALALAGAATFVALGCGHTPCETDADCGADFVCNAKACTRRSTPKPPEPSECGDRCEVGRTRCEYEPLSSSVARCDVAQDGCSKWTITEACGEAGFCQGDARCAPYLGEGAPCGEEEDRCDVGLTCGDLERFGVPGAPTCRRACDLVQGCHADETCVLDACVPAELCACSPGESACGPSGAPVRCEVIAAACGRWVEQAPCAGSDVCSSGACVGTLDAGASCVSSGCRAGLVCLDDTHICTPTCTESATCRTGACVITRASRGAGICATADGPTVETQCSLTLGTLVVPGDGWDAGLTAGFALPPDPYVVVAGGELYFQSGASEDQSTVMIDQTTPLVPFASFHQTIVSVWDDDAPFSGPDFVASWRLVDHYAWDTAERSVDLTLVSGDVTLGARVNCPSR